MHLPPVLACQMMQPLLSTGCGIGPVQQLHSILLCVCIRSVLLKTNAYAPNMQALLLYSNCAVGSTAQLTLQLRAVAQQQQVGWVQVCACRKGRERERVRLQ